MMTAIGLLWASRFVRERALVYIGLWHLVASILELSRWFLAGSSLGMLTGWLALALVLTALVLWLAGVGGRRCRLEETYWVPCLNTALALLAGVFVLAVLARAMTREAYAISAATLVLDSLVCLLIGRSRRWAPLTYPSVASFVTASYVVLLSTGRNDPAMAYVLGLNAVHSGALALGPRRCLPPAGECLDEGVRTALVSLGSHPDLAGHPAGVSITGHDDSGGDLVPALDQEPATSRMDLSGRGRA